MILTVLLLSQQMMLSVYASEVEFTDVSKLMEAAADLDALEQPAEGAAVVTSFSQGTPILVTGESESGWYRLTYQGKDCYIKMDTVKVAAQIEGEALEELNKEMELLEQENKIIIEEVERVRAEQKRSTVWTIVIAVLIVAIFAVGIYSTIRANRLDKEKETEEKTDNEKFDEEELSEISLPKEQSAGEPSLDIIDLDKTDVESITN